MAQKVLIAALVFLLITALFVFLAIRRISGRLEGEVVKAAAENGTTLAFKKFTTGLNGVAIEGLNVLIGKQKLPLGFELEELNLLPSYTKLLSRTLTFKLSGGLYGGTLSGLVDYSFSEDRFASSLQLKNLQATKHPALKALGINEGFLNLEISRLIVDHVTTEPAVKEAAFKLLITGVSRKTGKFFDPASFLPVALPSFSDLNLEIECEGQDLNLSCARIESSSNLGTVNGTGGMRGKGRGDSVALKADVALSQEGQKYFGAFLPLLSGGRVAETQGMFSFELSGPLSKPRWLMTSY